MIDVTAPAGLLPPARREALRKELGTALPPAEGALLASPDLESTGVFLHEPASVATGEGGDAHVVRAVVTTRPGAPGRQGQKDLIRAAAEWGWDVSGCALGREEFAALRAG